MNPEKNISLSSYQPTLEEIPQVTLPESNLEIAEELSADEKNASKLHRRLDNAKRLVQGASAVELALKHSPERVQRRVEDIALRRIFRTHGFDIRHVSGGAEEQKALELEQNIWHQEGYGNLDVYEKFIPQSRIFAAFDGERCVGMNRLCAGSPEVPPFIAEMPVDDPALKQDLINRGKELKVEEFGTVGVVKELRGGRTFLDICRMAFRDAEQRGVQTWGIIMEPERVEKMNKGLGFTFKQIGPEIDYQGGMCAAHIMDFDEVHANMQSAKPGLYDWFVNEPL